MAADYGRLAENLRRFYDFTSKVVLFVGAGGKQLDPALRTQKLIAIDQDVEALRELKTNIDEKGMHERVDVVGSDFKGCQGSADVVYLEFSLHEMVDPLELLTHASTLAPGIVVFDHSPGSDRAFYPAEEDKVRCSTEAMKRFGVRRCETLCTEQGFRDHAELLAKVTAQGAVAIERVQRFAGATNIAISMSYQLALQ